MCSQDWLWTEAKENGATPSECCTFHDDVDDETNEIHIMGSFEVDGWMLAFEVDPYKTVEKENAKLRAELSKRQESEEPEGRDVTSSSSNAMRPTSPSVE
ncbi:hypothetical protein ACS0TY_006286 [Phlomoides rotata]